MCIRHPSLHLFCGASTLLCFWAKWLQNESLQHGAAPALHAQASSKALKVRGHGLTWWWLDQALLQTSPAPLLVAPVPLLVTMAQLCLSSCHCGLGKGWDAAPGPPHVLGTCRHTSPGVSRNSTWLQLCCPPVRTHWGRTLPAAKVGSPETEEEKEGAGASQSIKPLQ